MSVLESGMPFALKTSVAQLRPSSYFMNMRWEEITPRTVKTGDSFFNGTIDFEWTLGKSNWALLQFAYVRLRAVVGKTAAISLLSSDNTGLSINPLAAMIDKARLDFNKMSIINIDKFAQVSTLHDRMMYSDAQYKTLLRQTGGLDASFNSRQAKVTRVVTQDSSSGSDLAWEHRFRSEAESASSIAATDTLALAVAGTFTWVEVVADGLDLRNYWNVGDYLGFNDADTAGSPTKIAVVTAVDQLVLTVGAGVIETAIAAAAANNASVNVHKVYPPDDAVGPSLAYKEIDIYMRPSLALFTNPDQSALPTGDYRLSFDIFSKDRAVKNFYQSTDSDKVVGTSVYLSPVDIHLYMPVIVGPPAPAGLYYLQFIQTKCNIGSNKPRAGTAVTEKFSVNPSTKALTFAFQDGRDRNTRYDISRFMMGSGDDALRLEELRVNYASQTKPNIPVRMRYEPESGIDEASEMYYRTMFELEKHLSIGGSEPLNRYRSLGPYYFMMFQKEGGHKATAVDVNYTFSSSARQATLDEGNVLCFEHAQKTVEVTLNDAGSIVSVVETYV